MNHEGAKTRRRNSKWLWVVVTSWVLIHGPAALSTPAATLTAKDIDEAIQWGSWGEPPPAPYVLYTPAGARPEFRGAVGVVYTPFVRVALAAKIARDAGRQFTPADVDAHLTEPIVYVGMRWYCCVDDNHGTTKEDWNPRLPPTDYKIATPADRSITAPYGSWVHLVAYPLWVSDDLSKISQFGPLPYDDIVLVAAYPVSVLSSGHDFVIYRIQQPTETSRWRQTMTFGRVTPADLARWR